METLGVILARSGSLGLARKHVLPLLGRPVVEYTFDHAQSARRLNRIVVTTDCPGVRAAAQRRGLMVINRPAQLATADASVQNTVIHAIDACKSDPDAVVVLYGNVPVRGVGVIDRALEMLEQTGCDSVRSFCPVGKWHPAWMSRLVDGKVEALSPGSIHRRQDLPPVFLHDGAVVAVSRQALQRARQFPDDPHAFFGVDRRGIETEMGETVEIDHLRDLYWAEAVLRERKKEAA